MEDYFETLFVRREVEALGLNVREGTMFVWRFLGKLGWVSWLSAACLPLARHDPEQLQEMMDPGYYDDTKRGGSKNHSIFLRGICMVVRIRGQDRIQRTGAGCLVHEFRS